MTDTDLERILSRIEVQKTYPPLMIKLVEEIHKEAYILYNDVKVLRRMASEILDRGLVNIRRIGRNTSALNRFVCGIDGSFYVLKSIGRVFLGIIGLALVSFTKGFESIRQPDIDVKVLIEKVKPPPPISPEDIIGIRMMIGESKLIEKASSMGADFVFIDGPIIDPPSFSDPLYVKERTKALINSLEKGTTIIGVVKRFESTIIASSLGNDELLDTDILPILFNTAYKKFGIPRDTATYTNPIIISSSNGNHLSAVFNAYSEEFAKHNYELRIIASFIQPGYGKRPFRVEIISPESSDMEEDELINLVAAWITPGLDVPLPVYLAHHSCMIRKRVAQLVLSEALSRLASTAEEEDLSNIKALLEYGEVL